MTSVLCESKERNKNIKGDHVYTNEIIIGKSFFHFLLFKLFYINLYMIFLKFTQYFII